MKNDTLTKIDPGVLKVRRPAISQHAAGDGTRVTTNFDLSSHPLLLADPVILDADINGFADEDFRDAGADEDDSRGYYVARVRFISPPPFVSRLNVTRTTHSSCGSQSAICSLRNSSDSKAEVYLLEGVANSAARPACTVALIVLQYSSFVPAV